MDTERSSKGGMGCRHCQFDKVRTVFGIHKRGDGILSWCTLTFPYLKLSMAAFCVSELRIEGVIEEIIVRTVLVILNTIS